MNHEEAVFEAVRKQFGCGYYTRCPEQMCPCKLKNTPFDASILDRKRSQFEEEGKCLFGA